MTDDPRTAHQLYADGWHRIEDCPNALKVGAANTRAETAEAENERLRAIVQKIGEVLNEAPESDLKRALHAVFLGAIVDRVLGDD